MKIVIAPDKFKDSLSSMEVCRAIRKGIKKVEGDAVIFQYPMADGGDGFIAVMNHYLGSVVVNIPSYDPLGREMESSYLWSPQNETAIIELAACSGLSLLSQEERSPLFTSTFGTGLQIKHAIENGAKKIILGLGGSATNDAGTGILQALGFQFLDEKNEVVKPCGDHLIKIRKIESPGILPDVIFEIAADVTNPLYGKNGAAFIYGPQKGATPKQVLQLDNGLIHFASLIRKETGKSIATIPGTGAAGGIAAGLIGYFNTTIKRGIDLVIEASGINSILQDADLVITGEGKMDDQTFQGKTAGAIAQLCKQAKVPCIAFCGILDLTAQKAKKTLFDAIIEIGTGLTKEESIKKTADLLENKAFIFVRNMTAKS